MEKQVVDIAEFEALKTENLMLKMKLSSLERMIFGSKRERYISPSVDPAQGNLFGEEAKTEQSETKPNSAKEEKATAKNKKAKKKNPKGFPANLKRKEERIEPEGLDLDRMKVIGEDVTELLAYQEGYFYIRRIVRPRYAPTDGSDGIYQANIPERLIPKGKLDESLIAQLIIEKCYFHTPIDRFAKKMSLLDCEGVTTSTLHNGFHRAAECLSPLYDLLVKDLQQGDYLQADESPIKVLNHAQKKKESKGYMWIYRSPITGAVVFVYDASRSQSNPDTFLKNFKGHLQTDGYTAYDKYDKLDDITLMNCMAHARRYFEKALDNDQQRADYFLRQVQILYALERKARDEKFSPQQRLNLRQTQAIPILNTIKVWLDEQLHQVLPSSAIGKAIAYACKRWKWLCVYTTDGRLEIDNNLIENKVRPLALGRKNYLFAHNEHTAQNIALFYSLMGSCEAAQINPRKYMSWLLKKIVSDKITPIAVQWLPHNIDPSILELF
jgi:transposase